jgi:hypothetical protein
MFFDRRALADGGNVGRDEIDKLSDTGLRRGTQCRWRSSVVVATIARSAISDGAWLAARTLVEMIPNRWTDTPG